ncbi:FtsX-like permease family protein [Streptomyces subrutilus]|uniref:FtsX-like permease family protein n=1 Tax=Streptomyces subrutilus TaxID=36818 RepID=UPI0033E9378F
MLGFVMRRLRGRLPLAAAVLFTVLITTTVLTALLAFTRGVGEAGLRQALQGREHDRSTVVVTSDRPAGSRGADEQAVRDFAAELFGPVPVAVDSLARSRSYGLPGPAASGKEADLTLLASFDRAHVRLLAGRWPQAQTAPGRVAVAVPRAALTRLGLAEAALPAEVRLADRYGGAPLDVLVTGVYRAADPADPYWTLDPLGGRELQVSSFTTYGPLLVDDSAFTSGAVPQNGRGSLLDPDFGSVRTAAAEAIRDRAAGLAPGTGGPGGAGAAAGALKAPAGFQVKTELPRLLDELASGQTVARSTLMVGALQLAVLAAAALLLVSRLLTERQESERVLLTARGASRLRLGTLGTVESLLLALPAAVLAPLLTPPLLKLLHSFGPLSRIPLDTSGGPLLWPVAAACAAGCVLLTALPTVLRGAGAAALRRSGRRQALVAGTARSGADLALVALAVIAYRQLDRYSGSGAPAARPGTGDGLGIDPVLVAAPTLALCAGTLLALRLLPFAARLGGRIAERGSGLGPALVGWQLARRPKRATGPVLLLVLAVSSGVLALGQHSAWTASQRDQADFATAGGLRISGSDLPPMGRGGRYAALPGGDGVIPVVRTRQELPGGKPAQVLALDALAAGERVPLRADLRDERPVRELFAPLAAARPAPGDVIELPGRPRRIDLDVTVRPSAVTEAPSLGLLLRDRFGLTHRSPMLRLPGSGDGTVSVDLDTLTGAPLGTAAQPLALAGAVLSYRGPDGLSADAAEGPQDPAELTVRRIAVSDAPGGPGVTVPVPAPAPAWTLDAPPTLRGGAPGEVLPVPASGPGAGALLRLRYQGGPDGGSGFRIALTPGRPPAAEVPGIATRSYLAAVGAAVGDVVPVPLGDSTVPVRITAAVGSLPVAGDTALAVDLATAGRLLAADGVRELPPAAEWWMPARSASDPLPARAAAELRAGAGAQQVELREEAAAALLDDPLSAGPQSALAALALACAVLAAIGCAAAAAAAGRERSREFAVLLALGTPRGKLTRTAAAESGLLVGLASAVGIGLGAAIVHLMAPLVVLTPAARPPVPPVLVDLPAPAILLMAAAIAAVPLWSAVRGARNDRDVTVRLRNLEDM